MSVALRWEIDGLARVLKSTRPGPLPEAPDVTCTQASAVVAVHAQPVCVVTSTLLAPPLAGTVRDAGATVNVQTPAASA
jgi:hypothetical protein